MQVAVQLTPVQRHRRSGGDVSGDLMELDESLAVMHDRLDQQDTVGRVVRQLLGEDEGNALGDSASAHGQCLSVVSIHTVTGNASRGDTLQGRSS
ncbi:hypothetical protein CN983_28580, partial [Bacillus cereus]